MRYFLHSLPWTLAIGYTLPSLCTSQKGPTEITPLLLHLHRFDFMLGACPVENLVGGTVKT